MRSRIELRERAGIKPIGREGADEGKWFLLDFGDIVVHVFQPEEREFYRLDRLWGEAPRLQLPEDVASASGATSNAPVPITDDPDVSDVGVQE